ncbi:MAG TPA: TRIC cation channel family protein [Opitutaceae bacterium]|jgi:uncharacterized membrane protein YeiH|nr:TRIC cation channel family protein [Opitutaceae bacterium]
MNPRHIFDAAAILSCSVMAVLVSIDRHRRFGAAMTVGAVASVAGGTLRDLCLGSTPVFWVREPWQIYLALAATAAIYLPFRKGTTSERTLQVPDALSVAIPGAIGARASLDLGHGSAVACVIGVVAGMIGGILRDLLCQRQPAVLKRELYGATALIGSAVVCLLDRAGLGAGSQLLAGSLIGAGARVGSVRYHVSFGRLLLGEPIRKPSR